MAIAKRLLRHLDKCNIQYTILSHRKVFTAFDLAQTLGEEGAGVAKTVLVRADRGLALVSVPAHNRLDFARIAKVLGVKKVSLAPERAVEELKIREGTTPPFGSFYKIVCVLDSELAKQRNIICRSGSHTESLVCSVKDYIASEAPIIAKVSERVKRRVAKKATTKKTVVKKKRAKKVTTRKRAR